MVKVIANTPTNNATLTLEQMGTPGIVTSLMVIPQLENDPLTNEQKATDIAPRDFVVSARFSSRLEDSRNVNFNFTENDGSSLLTMLQDVAVMETSVSGVSFSVHRNENNEISKALFKCIADSTEAARITFYKFVAPFIDALSYIANVPLHIQQVTIEDKMHNITTTYISVPHPEVRINPGVATLQGELFPFYALYREGKNSPSGYYKFLCYYKIIEGAFGSFHHLARRNAKIKGIACPSIKAKVPYVENVTSRIQEYAGKSIKHFSDTCLAPEYRNAIAHFSVKGSAPLLVSDAWNTADFQGTLAVMELCCRELISEYEEIFRLVGHR